MDVVPEPETTAAGKRAVADVGAKSATSGESSAKSVAAEDNATAKLRRTGVDQGSDAGAGPNDAAADPTVKLGKAAAADPVDAPEGEDELGAEGDGFWSSMRPLEWVVVAVAVLALLGLAGGGGVYFYHQSHADALASERGEYLQTAKQAILNLTNIKDDTASQDIDRVLSVASGDLKAEYSQRKDAYAQVVKEAKVKASGEVIEAAIESQQDDSAQVLVAAKQTLTNAGDSQPQDRYYRFRVTVNRGDGGVTASKVEFVA
ncbi:hypothetical protein [Nocardia macrotermitis]|nr:hypothetical protein [Nocardia macrotermitis]